MVLTNEQFRDAVSYLSETSNLPAIGAKFVDADKQVVLDEGNSNADITPDEATLTQALADLANEQAATEQAEQVASNARLQVANVLNYANWTEQEVIDHITANVTDLASAKTVLIALARMVVALRNKTFPDLEG